MGGRGNFWSGRFKEWEKKAQVHPATSWTYLPIRSAPFSKERASLPHHGPTCHIMDLPATSWTYLPIRSAPFSKERASLEEEKEGGKEGILFLGCRSTTECTGWHNLQHLPPGQDHSGQMHSTWCKIVLRLLWMVPALYRGGVESIAVSKHFISSSCCWIWDDVSTC